jgi:hypothetical protein
MTRDELLKEKEKRENGSEPGYLNVIFKSPTLSEGKTRYELKRIYDSYPYTINDIERIVKDNFDDLEALIVKINTFLEGLIPWLATYNVSYDQIKLCVIVNPFVEVKDVLRSTSSRPDDTYFQGLLNKMDTSHFELYGIEISDISLFDSLNGNIISDFEDMGLSKYLPGMSFYKNFNRKYDKYNDLIMYRISLPVLISELSNLGFELVVSDGKQDVVIHDGEELKEVINNPERNSLGKELKIEISVDLGRKEKVKTKKQRANRADM